MVRGSFLRYLQSVSAVRVVHDHVNKTSRPPLVESFRRWLKLHCGAAELTLKLYSYGVTQLVKTLGDAPSQYASIMNRSHQSLLPIRLHSSRTPSTFLFEGKPIRVVTERRWSASSPWPASFFRRLAGCALLL